MALNKKNYYIWADQPDWHINTDSMALVWGETTEQPQCPGNLSENSQFY